MQVHRKSNDSSDNLFWKLVFLYYLILVFRSVIFFKISDSSQLVSNGLSALVYMYELLSDSSTINIYKGLLDVHRNLKYCET